MSVTLTDAAAGQRPQRGRGAAAAGRRTARALGWLALFAAGSAPAAGVPAAGVPAAEPAAALSIRLSAAAAAPWQALAPAEREAIAAAVQAHFARALGAPVAARFCEADCGAAAAPGLAMALGGLREGTPSGGFSITFSGGDARDAGAVKPTLLPVVCAYAPAAAAGEAAVARVEQAVRPERLAAGALQADYLAAQLYHACRDALAGLAPDAGARRYTADPEVYLQRQAAVTAPGAGQGAGRRGAAVPQQGATQYLLHTRESEVTVQLGNNGLNR